MHYRSRLSLRKNVLVKQPIIIAIAMVMHYFHLVLEHGLPPSLNLNHNAYSIFPRIYVRRESMARGTRHTGTFYLCQSLVNELYRCAASAKPRPGKIFPKNLMPGPAHPYLPLLGSSPPPPR